MRGWSSLLATFLLCSPAASAQNTVDPVGCRATAGDPGAIAVEHDRQTYHVTSEQCRQQFLADPERYTQLFETLEELEAAGRDAPAPASLVPS